MPSEKDFDVAVVGTGPAGCTAAILLSRAGLRVVQFEKARLPRYKTCGGGLLQRTLRAMPVDVRGAVESECFVAELHERDPALRFSTRRSVPVVSMVMRDTFDHLLAAEAQASGTHLFSPCEVTDVSIDPHEVTLNTTRGEFFAQFVIAADGVNSVVARRCGYPALRDLIPAVECELEVDEERLARFAGAARFDFGFTPYGYGWVFPKRGHLSVGVLTTKRGSCNLNEEYLRYVSAIGLGGAIREQRHGYMIPASPRKELFSRSRVLLVGDAAGLVDPVTAEGISAAVRSGSMAANAVIAEERDPKRVMRAYRAALEHSLLPELRIARMLAYGLYGYPRVRGWLLKHHGQRLSEFATDVMMGERSYRGGIKRPAAILKMLLGAT